MGDPIFLGEFMCNSQEMKFYTVDTNYLNKLREIDNRVPLNKEFVGDKKKSRPYIGVMLKVDGIEYLVPLTSQTKRKASYVNYPIRDKESKKIAFLMINNMLPVPEKYRTELNMEGKLATDPQYYDLLLNEINYLRPKKTTIMKRCEDVRAVKVKGENRATIGERVSKYCLPLDKLEEVYNDSL